MGRVGRRQFLIATGALLAVPLVAKAQRAGKIWRIGVLRPGPDDAVFRQNFDPFLQALRDRGFTDGKNLTLELRVRPANPQEMLVLASELVRARVDAIVAASPAAVSAAAKATTQIPVVAVDTESDPVASGFAASLARPGGNITGLFLDFPEMGGKWLQLLKEVAPKLTRAAVLWDPAIGHALLNGVEAAASSIGVRIVRLEARGPADFAPAFQSAATEKADALLVLGTPAFYSAHREIADLAIKHRLPSIMPYPPFADDRGLMAYGPSLAGMFRQAGGVTAKILQGARPKEIAIERPTRFELVVNLKTASALGLTIPQTVLLFADRVIE